jgi:thymidylate kinase
LLDAISKALTPNRLPLLIAIDGADGCGKSSLSSWLAWQLGMPAIQLDLYLTDLHPIRWRIDDSARAVAHRIDGRRPLIVDGVLVLDALDIIKRKAGFHVWVSGGYTESSLAPQIADYQSRQRPLERADFTIDGYKD